MEASIIDRLTIAIVLTAGTASAQWARFRGPDGAGRAPDAAPLPAVLDRETRIVWQFPRGVPECPSPLYHEGRLYVIKNGGIARCLNARTGALHFSDRIGARGPRYSSPVAGDGKIYTASAQGVVTVLAAGDELKVLSQHDFGERTLATPALAGGRVYVRTERHLYAFE